jgi:type IV secretion system protein TrbL
MVTALVSPRQKRMKGFCFAAVFAATFVLLGSVASAADVVQLGGFAEDMLEKFGGRLAGYESGVREAALALFGILFLCQFAWSVIQLILHQSFTFASVIGTVVRQMMTGGFFYWLLFDQAVLKTIVASFSQLASLDISYTGLLTAAGAASRNLMAAAAYRGGLTLEGIALFFSGLTASVTALYAITLALGYAMVVQLENLIAGSLALIFLGFGGSDYTRPYAFLYIRSLVRIGFKLFLTSLLLIVGSELFTAMVSGVGDMNGKSLIGACLAIIGESLLFAAIVKFIPEAVSTFMGGASIVEMGSIAAAGTRFFGGVFGSNDSGSKGERNAAAPSHSAAENFRGGKAKEAGVRGAVNAYGLGYDEARSQSRMNSVKAGTAGTSAVSGIMLGSDQSTAAGGIWQRNIYGTDRGAPFSYPAPSPASGTAAGSGDRTARSDGGQRETSDGNNRDRDRNGAQGGNSAVTILPGGTAGSSRDDAGRTADSRTGNDLRDISDRDGQNRRNPQDEQRRPPDGDNRDRDRNEAQAGNTAVTVLPGGTAGSSRDDGGQATDPRIGNDSRDISDRDGQNRSGPQDEQRRPSDGDNRDRDRNGAQAGNSAVTVLPGGTAGSSEDDTGQEKDSIDDGSAPAAEDEENVASAVTVLPGWPLDSSSKARSGPAIGSAPESSGQAIAPAFLPLPLSGVFDDETNSCIVSAIAEFIVNTRSVSHGDALRAYRKMKARDSVLAGSSAQGKLEEILGTREEASESDEIDVIVRSVEQVRGTQTWQAEWIEENRRDGGLLEGIKTYMGDFEAGLFETSESESGTGNPSEILILDFNFVNIERG